MTTLLSALQGKLSLQKDPPLHALQSPPVLAHVLQLVLCLKKYPGSSHSKKNYFSDTVLSGLAHRIFDAMVLFLAG